MFYARAINSTLYQAIIGSGVAAGQINPTINPNTTCAPQFPQLVPATCLAAIPTAYYIDPNFKVPQIHQADLTLEQQFGKNDVFSVSWLGSWGRRLPDFVDTKPAYPDSSHLRRGRSKSHRPPRRRLYRLGECLLLRQRKRHSPSKPELQLHHRHLQRHHFEL